MAKLRHIAMVVEEMEQNQPRLRARCLAHRGIGRSTRNSVSWVVDSIGPGRTSATH